MNRDRTVIIVLLLAALACGGSPATTPTTSAPAATTSASNPAPERGFYMGVAGLIPANFPDSSEKDWLNLYEYLPETGELLGVHTSWTDSEETEGEVPGVVEVAFAFAEQYDFIPLVALGTYRDAAAGEIETTISWTDADQVARFRQAAVRIAEQYQPLVLSLGIEINRYYDHDPDGFAAFVVAYSVIYDAIKAVSPDTLVFTVFQLETLRGAGYLTGTSQGRQAHWELLDMFGERLDLAVFTTYPYFDYTSPGDVPDDYYAAISEHTDRPIAFSESGWPSAPLSTAPDSDYGGSEIEQADFVLRLFDLTANLDLGFAVWSFPNDIGPAINPAFESVSLRHNDGTPKPALDIWRSIVMQARVD